MDCLFCRILAGEIPSRRVYEDEQICVIHDVNPQAPVHVLILPRAHIASAAELRPEHAALMGHLWTKLPDIARGLGLDGGFRVITNSGDDGGQTVGHLHFHLIGGQKLTMNMA